MQSKPNILLIYTGGTIGMMKDFETGVLKAFNFKKLLQKIPKIKSLECSCFKIFHHTNGSTGINQKYFGFR